MPVGAHVSAVPVNRRTKAVTNSPVNALFPHGGARNCADRTSDCLTLAQARKIIAALERAERSSRYFNRHIIVHWEATGVPDSWAMAATTRWLKAFREWAGGDTAYVWTRENGDKKGSHLHLLAHIPKEKRWHGAIARRWLERISGNTYRQGTIKTRQPVTRKSFVSSELTKGCRLHPERHRSCYRFSTWRTP